MQGRDLPADDGRSLSRRRFSTAERAEGQAPLHHGRREEDRRLATHHRIPEGSTSRRSRPAAQPGGASPVDGVSENDRGRPALGHDVVEVGPAHNWRANKQAIFGRFPPILRDAVAGYCGLPLLRGGHRRGAGETTARPASGRTIQGTSARSCWIRTATTSRRCTTERRGGPRRRSFITLDGS